MYLVFFKPSLLSLSIFRWIISLLSSSHFFLSSRCHLPSVCSPGTPDFCKIKKRFTPSPSQVVFAFFNFSFSLFLISPRSKIQPIYPTCQAVYISCRPPRLRHVKVFCFFRCFPPKPTESPPDLIGPINKLFCCKRRFEAK